MFWTEATEGMPGNSAITCWDSHSYNYNLGGTISMCSESTDWHKRATQHAVNIHGHVQAVAYGSQMIACIAANNCMHFDTLPKHCALNSKEYTGMLSILIKAFENRFQDCQKKSLIYL